MVMPQLSVQLQIQQSDYLRTAQLVSAGTLPEGQAYESYAGWRRLELALRAAVRTSPGVRNRHGYALALAGLALATLIAMYLTRDPQGVAQGLCQMLRLH